MKHNYCTALHACCHLASIKHQSATGALLVLTNGILVKDILLWSHWAVQASVAHLTLGRWCHCVYEDLLAHTWHLHDHSRKPAEGSHRCDRGGQTTDIARKQSNANLPTFLTASTSTVFCKESMVSQYWLLFWQLEEQLKKHKCNANNAQNLTESGTPILHLILTLSCPPAQFIVALK